MHFISEMIVYVSMKLWMMMLDTRFKGARRRVILKTRHFHAFRLLYTIIRLTFLVAEYFLYILKYIKTIFEVIMPCRIYELNCLFKLSCPFFFRTNKNIKIFLIFKIKYPSPIPHDVYVSLDFSQIDYLKNVGNYKTITDNKLSLNTILHDFFQSYS